MFIKSRDQTPEAGADIVPTNGKQALSPSDGGMGAMPQYDADPSDAFDRHFENLGHGIGAPEELLKTGSDLVELMVRSRIPIDKLGAIVTLLLKADCEEMLEQSGCLSLATYSRMAAAYLMAGSIGVEGGARREFVQSIIAERNRAMGRDQDGRRGFFNRQPQGPR